MHGVTMTFTKQTCCALYSFDYVSVRTRRLQASVP